MDQTAASKIEVVSYAIDRLEAKFEIVNMREHASRFRQAAEPVNKPMHLKQV